MAHFIDFERLQASDPLELYIETAQNYYDLVSRFGGGNITDRTMIQRKRALVVVGTPIVVARGDSANGGRKSDITALAGDLERAFLGAIEEVKEERQAGAR